MQKYRYLLLDADDTLFDFQRAEREAFRLTCEASGVEYTEALCGAYSRINDALWKKLEVGGITLTELKTERYRQLLEGILYPAEGLCAKAEEMRDEYVRFLGEQSDLLPGVAEACRRLSERYELYIITNGVSQVQRRRFSRSPLMAWVKGLFISEEIGAAKPQAAYFDFVLAAVGDPDRSRYLVVGDSLTSDMRGAAESGLASCFVNWRRLTPTLPVTYTIGSFRELEGVLAATEGAS